MLRYLLTLVLGIVLYVALPRGALALVNINSASRDVLISDAVPNVGAATADKIVNYRKSVGAFQNLAQVCAQLGQNGFGEQTATCQEIGAAIYFGPLETVEDTQSEASSSSNSTSSGSGVTAKVTKATTPGPITQLILTVPEKAYTGQLLSFDVNPDDGKGGRTARYKWNFGDGTTYDFKRPSHRYTHPGTYVVMVESYYQKQTTLARKEIEILPLALKLETLSAKEVRVINNGSYEIDLGSMNLIGNSTFTFPKYTILLPEQSLVAKVDNGGGVVLKDGEGVVLAVGAVEASALPRSAPTAIAKRTVAAASTQAEATSTEEVLVEEDISLAATQNQTASIPAADIPPEAWPYLALFAVMGLGIFAIYGTRS